MPPSEPSTTPARSRVSSAPSWLYGPALDLLIGCGAWSLPLLVATFWLERVSSVQVAMVFYLLGVFCNNPHYMATVYRAYHTSADFNKYRFFTVYVTVFLLLTVVLVHSVPTLFPWVVTLYLTWSPWHYTGQNFGIAQLFIRRTGSPPDKAARSLLYGSYAASYAVWFLTLHSILEGDPNFLSLRIPASVALPCQLFFALAFLFFAAAAFFRLRKHLTGAALFAPLLLTLTQLCWFVAPALLTRFTGLKLSASYFSAGALAFMHCAQYLWITTYYAKKERPTSDRGPAFSFPKYYLTLIFGGIALFIPGPWLASRLFHQDLAESVLIFMGLVNLHHFILDGAIWKLRDGRIARFLLGRNAPEAGGGEAEMAEAGLWSHVNWLFGKTRTARVTRYAIAAAIISVGAVDQAQYYFTRRDTTTSMLAWAEALNPQDTRVNFRRAQLALAEGNPTAARTELEHIIALNPRNAPAQHLLGEIVFRSGDATSALAHYDRMAELFRPDLSIALNRGLLAQHLGQPALAVTRFEEALVLAPQKIELHYMLAEALAAKGESEKALQQYERFATFFEESLGSADEHSKNLPSYLRTGLLLGDQLRAQKNLAAAQSRFERTARIAVKFHHFDAAAVALDRLADVDTALGQPEEATKNRAAARQLADFAKQEATHKSE